MNSQNYWVLTSASTPWFSPKNRSQGICKYCKNTYGCLLEFGMKSSFVYNAVFRSHFRLIKGRKYLAPYFGAEDFSVQVRGPAYNYVYGCHMAQVARGALGYVVYQEGIVQGRTDDRSPTREAISLCSRIVFRTVPSLDISSQIVFVYYMSLKYIWDIISDDLSCPCYPLVVMPNRRNQRYFSSATYMRAQVNSSAIAYTCWLFQTFK